MHIYSVARCANLMHAEHVRGLVPGQLTESVVLTFATGGEDLPSVAVVMCTHCAEVVKEDQDRTAEGA